MWPALRFLRLDQWRWTSLGVSRLQSCWRHLERTGVQGRRTQTQRPPAEAGGGDGSPSGARGWLGFRVFHLLRRYLRMAGATVHGILPNRSCLPRPFQRGPGRQHPCTLSRKAHGPSRRAPEVFRCWQAIWFGAPGTGYLESGGRFFCVRVQGIRKSPRSAAGWPRGGSASAPSQRILPRTLRVSSSLFLRFGCQRLFEVIEVQEYIIMFCLYSIPYLPRFRNSQRSPGEAMPTSWDQEVCR